MNTPDAAKPLLSDVTIRNTLRPGDLGLIASIHGDIYAKECGYGLNFEAYVLKGLGEFAQQYDPEKDKLWLCEHDNRVVGCLVAQHRADAVQLRYFIFLPEYRGIGLGKKLMGEFVAFMTSTGCKHAYLWTTEDQQAAIALYERYGFVLSEQRLSDAFDKELTEQKYELTLNQ
ncbi:GNAT family N-acetyltransferase [Dyadobacter jiangsuensis]|uniref:Acetyltransferase (GNAT) family protein n=1 Tax=Dyadobacter jiangsuensis TaxID=1591085 RepID=A0A2P8GIY7_9BACT|nr:GNAT family N-acetyltransferase [Dyadobacter jiangsuensis]PSL33928.1 acetyltransferase (GNAT) family protein [Dyadobacter jiangsuensis]